MAKFKINNLIGKIKQDNLRNDVMIKNKSNICLILDKHLIKKIS